MIKKDCKDIIIEWCIKNAGKQFKQHQVQSEIREYGIYYYGSMYNPDSYSRKFRELRENGTVVCSVSKVGKENSFVVHIVNGVKYV